MPGKASAEEASAALSLGVLAPISPFPVIEGGCGNPICWPYGNRESIPMDPFSFLVLLTMATLTLVGGSILLSLVVLERRPGPPRRPGAHGTGPRRRARKKRNRL